MMYHLQLQDSQEALVTGEDNTENLVVTAVYA